MQTTVRYRAVAVAGALAAALGAATGRPALLLGAAGAWAWLAAHYVAFARTAGRVATDLSVTRSLSPDRPRAGQRTSLETRATLEQPVAAGVAVSHSLPDLGRIHPADSDDDGDGDGGTGRGPGDDPALVVEPGSTDATVRSAIQFPVGGTVRLPRPRAAVADGRLFRATFPVGAARSVVVEPRRTLAIGDDHGRSPSSLREPASPDRASLHRYAPTDPASRIDWKVTGRLGDPHVRTYESDEPRRTVLVFDHGQAAAAPLPPGDLTVLDHLRDAALGLVDAVEDGVAVGLVTLADRGTTRVIEPDATSTTRESVREALRGTVPAGRSDAAARDLAADPGTSRRAADALAGDGSAFAAGLRPFLSSASAHANRLASSPLLRAVERDVPSGHQRTRYVVLTPGRRRVAVRKAVDWLRRDGDPVLVLLPPAGTYVRTDDAGHAPVPGVASTTWELSGRGNADDATANARREAARAFRRRLDSRELVTATSVSPWGGEGEADAIRRSATVAAGGEGP
jgi:uncharacterized protein (DUF58 family)